ncbi:MAG: FKBP-type peptidyl-prolyl cis-trans isomerase [Bacteroides sp.]|nr:FKBP-type peptidyl-prolyl cis-trans isomerase [Bacteroides sp.]
MKKISIFAAIAVAAGLASCTAQAPKANLKSELDSLSYMKGVQMSQGLDQYALNQLRVDSAYLNNEFVKGIAEGIKLSETEKGVAYIQGLAVGRQINVDMFKGISQQLFGNDSITLDKNNFLAGFFAAIKANYDQDMLTEASAYATIHEEAIKAKAMEEKYADNKAAGEKFLEENKTKEGVQTTASGLQYKVIKEGKGAIPTDSSTVKVNYKGTLIDGTEFDSSYKRNAPATFRANQVIKGWTEALTLMPVGSKWELYIPQELAYGARNAGQIKPFSTLIFEVELVSIEDKK